METEEEVNAADARFFAEETRKARAGKTSEQLRAEVQALLARWRSTPKHLPVPWWVAQ